MDDSEIRQALKNNREYLPDYMKLTTERSFYTSRLEKHNLD
jgi:hypothetical protein